MVSLVSGGNSGGGVMKGKSGSVIMHQKTVITVHFLNIWDKFHNNKKALCSFSIFADLSAEYFDSLRGYLIRLIPNHFSLWLICLDLAMRAEAWSAVA